MKPKFNTVRNKAAYQPYAMFNQDTYWVNKGGKWTTNYDTKNWKVMSTFYEYL